MTNDELLSILEWAEKRGAFTWLDLQNHFQFDANKMNSVRSTLRSNMPIKNNLVDHSHISGLDSNALTLTLNGRTMLINLKSTAVKNSGISAGGSITAGGDIIVGGEKITNKKIDLSSKNDWYQKPFGITLLAVIAGLIISGTGYLLGWNQ